MFLHIAAISKPCLLESSNVDTEWVELTVDDGGLVGVIDVVKAV